MDSKQNSTVNMNIVIVGHVDHGKSTVVGRLLADTNSLPIGKLSQIEERCRRNAKPFEYAFLVDALKDEQEQGITIDSARCFFKTSKRNYIIIDAPGHIEFLKNMVTGASRAEAALLVIDAYEGIQENSKRHGYLLSMLGIKQLCVLVNKMDLIGYNVQKYKKTVEDFRAFLNKIGLEASIYIPTCSNKGENIVLRSENMPWYDGATVLDALEKFQVEKYPKDKPLRMPVQDVYKFTADNDSRRIVAGTIETGTLNVGDEIVFLPSGKKSRVKSIESFNEGIKTSVSAGYSTGFTLTEQIYVKRGEVAARVGQSKPKIATYIKVKLFWLGKLPMEKKKVYSLKLGTAKVNVKIDEIIRVLDASTLQSNNFDYVKTNEVAECLLRLEKPIAFDIATDNFYMSRFVIVDNYDISGGGTIVESLEDSFEKKNVFWHPGNITYDSRCAALGQKGIVVWFTGISCSGKSTLAVDIEKYLFEHGKIAYRLDGDNLRHGLNQGLGFSRSDRIENIRRIAEVATLFKDAGIITLVATISPYKEMREYARAKVGEENFLEVFLKADIETCINRDKKGLYKRALNGEIDNFTAISSTYEEPDSPNLIIDTSKMSKEESLKKVIELIERYI